MKTAGVVVDDWKLPIFLQCLAEAGYHYEPPVEFTRGTSLLKVKYDWAHKLQPVIEAAQAECARARRHG